MPTERHPVRVDELLRTSRDKQVGLRWPYAVDQRLDALVERAVTAGERTNRRELLAALVFSVAPTGDELGGILRSYRLATIGDVILDARISGKVVSLVNHKPGPRSVDPSAS